MKCLFLSIKKWKTQVTDLSVRGNNIVTDDFRDELLEVHDTCALLITYEERDEDYSIEYFTEQFIKEFNDLGRSSVLLVPFAHLSHNLGNATKARSFFDEAVISLQEKGFESSREHFGSDKELELILKSHPGSVRFREY